MEGTPRRSKVRARVRRILRLGEVVRTDVDPRDEVLLRDVLTIEEFMEVDDGGAGQVLVPHAAAGRLRLLALAHSEVVPRPVGVLEQALRTDDRLSPVEHQHP